METCLKKSPLKIVIIDFRPIKIHHIFEKISHLKFFIDFIHVTLFLILIYEGKSEQTTKLIAI